MVLDIIIQMEIVHALNDSKKGINHEKKMKSITLSPVKPILLFFPFYTFL